MNITKRNILNNIKRFVLCWLALGCLAVGAYSQEGGKPGAKTKDADAPEILSVQPIGMNGEPHLRPGQQVILLGRNFSPVLVRNRVSLRIVTENPQTPPPVCEYVGEIHLTYASPEQLEGVMPLSIDSGYYLIWARVSESVYSKPVKVWVGSQPPPPSKPIIATEGLRLRLLLPIEAWRRSEVTDSHSLCQNILMKPAVFIRALPPARGRRSR